jgi:hypothetical protein
MKKSEKEKNEVEIFGIINSLEWDQDDNILSIELSTEENDYIIEPDDIGTELFDCVGEEVAVVGVITKSKSGSHRIKILNYEILGYDDDDDDDEDFYDDDDDEDVYYDDDDDDEYDDDEYYDDDDDEYRDDKR